MLLYDDRQTRFPTVQKFWITNYQPSCGLMRINFYLLMVPLLGLMLCFVLSNQLELHMPVLYNLLLMPNRYDFLKKLLLTFNSHTFHMLSNVINHICNYPEEETRIALYVNVVKQTLTIFDLRLVFADYLIKTLKKDNC